MRYIFKNDLGYLLEDLNGDYDLSEDQVEQLASLRLSPTRMTPVADLKHALAIERGEIEPSENEGQLYDPDFHSGIAP